MTAVVGGPPEPPATVAGAGASLAGFQYMSGGSVRAIESPRVSLYRGLVSFAIVILSKIIASLVGIGPGRSVNDCRRFHWSARETIRVSRHLHSREGRRASPTSQEL